MIHSDEDSDGGTSGGTGGASSEDGEHEVNIPQETGGGETEVPANRGSGFVLYYLNEGTRAGLEGLEGEGMDPARRPGGAAREFHVYPP